MDEFFLRMKFVRLCMLDYVIANTSNSRWILHPNEVAESTRIPEKQCLRALGDLGKILPLCLQFNLDGKPHWIVGPFTLKQAGAALSVILHDQHTWTSWRAEVFED